MKITITNIGYENFGGETDVLDVAFRIDGDEIYHAYLDADGDVDRDSLDVGGWDADEVVETLETMLKDKQDEIAKLISDSVFGSNDFTQNKQLFGVWLNSWGVFKYTGSDSECGVVVCHANDGSLRIDRQAKTFKTENEFEAWSNEMMQDDHYGDACIVNRAINDICGYDE